MSASPTTKRRPNPLLAHSFLNKPEEERDDDDSASQHSLPLSTPPDSPRRPLNILPTSPIKSSHGPPAAKRMSHAGTLDTDFSSEADQNSLYTNENMEDLALSPTTSFSPSSNEKEPDEHEAPSAFEVVEQALPSHDAHPYISPSLEHGDHFLPESPMEDIDITVEEVQVTSSSVHPISPTAKSPTAKSPMAKSPAAKSPTSPTAKSPFAKSLMAKSPTSPHQPMSASNVISPSDYGDEGVSPIGDFHFAIEKSPSTKSRLKSPMTLSPISPGKSPRGDYGISVEGAHTANSLASPPAHGAMSDLLSPDFSKPAPSPLFNASLSPSEFDEHEERQDFSPSELNFAIQSPVAPEISPNDIVAVTPSTFAYTTSPSSYRGSTRASSPRDSVLSPISALEFDASPLPSPTNNPKPTVPRSQPFALPFTLAPAPPATAKQASLPPPPTPSTAIPVTYPPKPTISERSTRESMVSVSSHNSSYSRKDKRESVLPTAPNTQLIKGIALVDFNHLEGPKIEYSRGDIFDDEEVVKILPFLALPDGAHLNTEDYSYFHLVPSGVNPTTMFGISCNRQIASADLVVKGEDVTRSTVQKAVVVLASKPVFGPIRDKLGVVTRALFEQKDFTSKDILDDWGSTLELSLRSQLTESSLYMGTSLRELVHTFRQRTLILVKALMLQKRIMFYGHPVERLCTYQYSLVSLLPGLLQTLEDCGSPPLAARAPTLSRPTSLRTSDRKSMMAFMGVPLDVFGKDAFFQPYLPLQQLDMLKDTPGWLCGSTNSIVTQQKEIDLLINTEAGTFEFRDPKLERSAGLTAADRKWMDDIVKDVNEGWTEGEDPTSTVGIAQFKGSDDYLRTKFEEYVYAALASVKYQDFISKGDRKGVIGSSGGDSHSAEDFNPLWISEFKKTNAYEVWERTTDPMIFDIIEPRHPCNEKPSVVADIGLRLSEGIQELKLEQQLAPTREAITRGATTLFEGVKGFWGRSANSSSTTSINTTASKEAISPPEEITKSETEVVMTQHVMAQEPSTPRGSPLRTLSLASSVPTPTTAVPQRKTSVSSWTSGIGSLWGSASKGATNRSSTSSVSSVASSPVRPPAGSRDSTGSVKAVAPGGFQIQPAPPGRFNLFGRGHSRSGSSKSVEHSIIEEHPETSALE